MKLGNMIFLTSALFLLVLPFQNCSKTSPEVEFSSDSTGKLSNQETDSGQPYDGKVYVLLGTPCDDGLEIHSRILLKSSGVGELNREHCQNIPPVTLAATDIQLDPMNSNLLIYKMQNFNLTAPPDLGLTNFLATSDATNFSFSYTYAGSPLFKHVYLDTDGSALTGFPHLGLGADILIENNNLHEYYGMNGAWGWTKIGSANLVDTAPNVQWTIPRISIGSPATIKAVADTSLGYHSNIIIP